MTVNTFSVLHAAHTSLRSAVAELSAADLSIATPCTEWTVAQVLEHAVLDQGIWATSVGGAPQVEGDAFAPSGVIPDDVAGYVDSALSTAAAAWADVRPEDAQVPSPLPQGALDGRTAEAAAALDAAIHAWDIAVAIGSHPVLDDELAIALTPSAHALVEPLRQWGAYAPELPTQAVEVPAATLLRYLGRDPGWSAR